MRVLLIHRYFWPDTPPYASMLLTIAKQLVKDGHQVEVVSTQPSYKLSSAAHQAPSLEIIDGVKIKRVSLFKERNFSSKLLNILYFPLKIFIYILLNRKIDIVMSSTSPPVVTGFFSALGAKLINAKFIYHCMDLHPEIGRISGEFKSPSFYKILLRLDQWTCSHANSIVVLSKDMKKSLTKRALNQQLNIKIINNFSLQGVSANNAKIPLEYKKQKGIFRILFAGNIGRFQMLEAFVDAINLLDYPSIELIFLGEGKELENLKRKSANNSKIKFFPHQPIEIARKIIADTDLGIVSLMEKVYKYAFPSKTMTYLENGCPLLVAVESESELTKFVSKNNIGFLALPNNPGSIASAIKKAIDSPEITKSMSKNCLKIAEKEFSEPEIAKKWSLLYKEIAGGH